MDMNVQSIKDFFRIASNEELNEVYTVLKDEVTAREAALREAEQMRRQWVEDWFLRYLAHPNAIDKEIGTTTVVALYNRSTGVHIATARCMPGDTYNYDTGVAVAFAKLCNEPIPHYI